MIRIFISNTNDNASLRQEGEENGIDSTLTVSQKVLYEQIYQYIKTKSARESWRPVAVCLPPTQILPEPEVISKINPDAA